MQGCMRAFCAHWQRGVGGRAARSRALRACACVRGGARALTGDEVGHPPVGELRGDGQVLQDSPSQQVLLGMKTDLTSLTQYEHPLYLGFMLGIIGNYLFISCFT